jgi:hypothetical protein
VYSRNFILAADKDSYACLVSEVMFKSCMGGTSSFGVIHPFQ